MELTCTNDNGVDLMSDLFCVSEIKTEVTRTNASGYHFVPFSYGNSVDSNDQKNLDAAADTFAFNPSWAVPESLLQNLNFVVLLIEKRDEDGQLQVLSAALEVAEAENLEVDLKFRALVAERALVLQKKPLLAL
ncbi:hypothetical protein BVRB_6g144170 [Beta vulgaris subsp. vulgaris]|uniref:Uncharacterized protein n=1 Tax=Beta vulgaris subsp. vulgaris TaxID=3555 RepID=A0A0J8C761_BETVV|nr:hypothetical protein BVRB_6g144170 [Beta vulgaris subsp. vulgaris]